MNALKALAKGQDKIFLSLEGSKPRGALYKNEGIVIRGNPH